MADNTEEEHIGNIPTIQTENPSENIILIKNTETTDPNK